MKRGKNGDQKMKTYHCVCGTYDADETNEYTLDEFLFMCHECFGQQPELSRDWDNHGTEYYRDERGRLVLQSAE